MTVSYDFGGKTIMITGGASGIGRATALLAARSNAAVAIVDASAESIAKTVPEIEAAGAKALGIQLDVRDSAACDAAVERIEKELGPIEGFVGCAGVSRPVPAELMSDDDWSLVIDINVNGLQRSMRPVARRMIERKRGAIVNISSVDGIGGHAARSHYAASKHAVIGMTRSFAIEWGRHGVRVNAVAPGVVGTPLLKGNIPPEGIKAMLDRVPMERMCEPEEQASAIIFLLSEGASYINGATLSVDGGITSGFFTHWHGRDYQSKVLMERGLYSAPADE